MAQRNDGINQHKAMAMGKTVTGMKHGGYVKGANGANGAKHADAAQDQQMIDSAFAKRGMKTGGKVKGGR